jgi:dCMP deaminase
MNNSEHISWDEFFMFSAVVASKRSKDPNTKVGAVVVDDTKIISSGYNGFCVGVPDDMDLWQSRDDPNPMRNKYMYVCHAEMNAITMCDRSCKGCTIYVTHFPCHECAKIIIQSGIRKIVFGKEWAELQSTNIVSKTLFQKVGVVVEQYNGKTAMTFGI